MVDNMTEEQRSRTMSRIRSKNTKAELTLRRLLHQAGYRYRLHAPELPGRPDIVFRPKKVAVFVDGDFFHGWQFKRWAHKLAPYWRTKIERNMSRDRAHTRRLRRMGWQVVRIWEHQIEKNPDACLRRIERALTREPIGTDSE